MVCFVTDDMAANEWVASPWLVNELLYCRSDSGSLGGGAIFFLETLLTRTTAISGFTCDSVVTDWSKASTLLFTFSEALSLVGVSLTALDAVMYWNGCTERLRSLLLARVSTTSESLSLSIVLSAFPFIPLPPTDYVLERLYRTAALIATCTCVYHIWVVASVNCIGCIVIYTTATNRWCYFCQSVTILAITCAAIIVNFI